MENTEKGVALMRRYKTLLNSYQVNTPLRKAHFLSQIEHESGLMPVSERLNYTVNQLITVFKYDFDINKDHWISEKEKEKAREVHGSPRKIANFVYANQNGNGNEASGDGYRYRGRGFIQITGRYNYKQLSNFTGIDYVASPDLLLTEADSMISALWYWRRINANYWADRDDIRKITLRINGGYNGLIDRIRLLNKYKKTFKV